MIPSQLLHPHIELGYYHKNLHPLQNFAEACRAGISERSRLQVLHDVAAALTYLHAQGFFHMKVCARNVLLFAERRMVLHRDSTIDATWNCWEEFTYTPRLGEFDDITCNTEPRAALLFPLTDTPERIDCYSWGLMAARAFSERPVDVALLFCHTQAYVFRNDLPRVVARALCAVFEQRAPMSCVLSLF